MHGFIGLLIHLETELDRVNKPDKDFQPTEDPGQMVFQNPDITQVIAKNIEKKSDSTTLARTNKTCKDAVNSVWTTYDHLCNYMDTLVVATRTEDANRQIDVCKQSDGNYLIRLCNRMAMAYVNIERNGATVTTVINNNTRPLRFVCAVFVSLYVKIKGHTQRITDPGHLSTYLSSLGVGDTESELTFNISAREPDILTTNTPFNNNNLTGIAGLTIWNDIHNHWQFYFTCDTYITKGRIIMDDTQQSAFVWGICRPTGNRLFLFSMQDGITSPEALQTFFATYNWNDNTTAKCVFSDENETINTWMHPK